MDSTRSYPLFWPEGWDRSKYQKAARFGDHSVAEGRRVLVDQVRLFGGSNLIISSNLELRLEDDQRCWSVGSESLGWVIEFKHLQDEQIICSQGYDMGGR